MVRACVLGGALLFCVACVPVHNQRGYVPDPESVESLTIGKDTKTTVAAALGNPSTSATFGNDVWYYISSQDQQVAFFRPTILSRDILAVEFNKDGQVADIRHYGLRDGRIIAFRGKETPAKGRELTILQQMFNAVPGTTQGPQQGGTEPNDNGP